MKSLYCDLAGFFKSQVLKAVWFIVRFCVYIFNQCTRQMSQKVILFLTEIFRLQTL